MCPPPDMADSNPSTAVTSAEDEALAQAINGVVLPLARLAVAKGMSFAVVESQLKQAFVQAAREAHPHLPSHRAVSRIATTTGINRREVTRLTQVRSLPPRRRPVAAELFARWANDPAYQAPHGGPCVLPRQGVSPSFESLAQSVTRDVHPRSLLDELLRLGLAVHDTEHDTVALVRDAFVPRGDAQRILSFLGDNVGDHLSAAVANVLGNGQEHLEQAVFGDELSAQSIERIRGLISAQWREITAAMVPAIESLIEQDRAAGRLQDRRLRIGLYTFTDSMDGTAPTTPVDPLTPAAAGNALKT
ncbi:MAG: DUF6502 family protein [Burkholderiales bacterium]